MELEVKQQSHELEGLNLSSEKKHGTIGATTSHDINE
jgi:hypothetical protein